MAASLDEPHIIPLHDFGEIDGRLFIDMRLVEGRDLRTAVTQDGPFPVERALRVAKQMASALDAAHARGLIHRDVKPENALLTRDDFTYLVDFGIAAREGEARLTESGATIGSWAYLAPERFDHRPDGPGADQYALACVLYEMLTGRRAFTAATMAGLMRAHLTAAPPQLPSHIDEDVRAAVRRGLSNDPDDRFDSCLGGTGASLLDLCPAADATPHGSSHRRAAGAVTGRRVRNHRVGPGMDQGRVPARVLSAEAASRFACPTFTGPAIPATDPDDAAWFVNRLNRRITGNPVNSAESNYPMVCSPTELPGPRDRRSDAAFFTDEEQGWIRVLAGRPLRVSSEPDGDVIARPVGGVGPSITLDPSSVTLCLKDLSES